MQAKLQGHSWMRIAVSHTDLEKGLGIIGGLFATLVMDLVLVSAFLVAGMPPFTCFSIVGDTVARLFSYQGLANSVPLGLAAHYLIGPVLGAIFGLAAQSAPALQRCSLKKAILFAVLFTEIMSQPMLALTPIFLPMASSDLLLWYAGSFGMHFLWGCVLGAVWSLRWQLPVEKNHRCR